jgi:glycosyltransferase involved in cell wall biosynthesis
VLRNATVLPNLPFACRESGEGNLPEPLASDHYGVIGTWTYSANARGLRWFLRKVWPLVLSRRPRARLSIAGAVPEELRRFAPAQDGIDWLGRVDDPAELYRRAAVFLAPILFGAGTNIKVLEGAAFGRPGVVTPVAMRGFGETLGKSGGLREAGDPCSFAAAMLALAEDPAAAAKAGERARAVVRESHTVDIFNQAVREGVRRALA